MATLKEYLLLSQIAYNDFFPGEKKQSIDKIIDKSDSSLNKFLNEEDKNREFWIPHLATIHDWTVINCQLNTKSGFAGAAFRSPAGETYIAFRGTEPPSILDFNTDRLIYTNWDAKLIDQFKDAKKFVCQTMKIDSLDKISKNNMPKFTGHSLGGALSDYLAYLTGCTSTTFNAVGFVQCLSNEEFKLLKNPAGFKKRIKDYCDNCDVIGNSGIHIGERIFLINDLTLEKPQYRPVHFGSGHNTYEYIKNFYKFIYGNLWRVVKYAYEDSIDKANDFKKKLFNSYCPVTALLTGSPHSHGLDHFLNDIGKDEKLIKRNIASSSEVAYCHELSKMLQLSKRSGIPGEIKKFVKEGIRGIGEAVDDVEAGVDDAKKAIEEGAKRFVTPPSYISPFIK
jgi:hypothetical protein